MKLRERSTQSAPQMRYSSKLNEENVDTLRLKTCSKSAENLALGHGGTLMCFKLHVCRVCVQ